jgi:hypothetical protein
MHWFWRALIAMILGYFAYTVATVVFHIIPPNNPLKSMGFRIWSPISFAAYGGGNYLYVFPLQVVCYFVVPTTVSLVTYAFLTRRKPPLPETSCRKCGYILKGITEPRCPECGEKI